MSLVDRAIPRGRVDEGGKPELYFDNHRPKNRLWNYQLARKFRVITATSDFRTARAIEEKFGIKYRPIAGEGETESFMAKQAAGSVVERLKGRVDYLYQSQSHITENDTLQDVIDAYKLTPKVAEIEHAACSGWVLAVKRLGEMGKQAEGANFMIGAADIYSNKMKDPTKDEGSMYIFGDAGVQVGGVYGRGLTVLSGVDTGMDTVDGPTKFSKEENDAIKMPNDYSLARERANVVPVSVSESGKFEMNGGLVLKAMLREVPPLMDQAVEESGVSVDKIKRAIFHQASLPMLTRLMGNKRMRHYQGKEVIKIRGGNLSSASVPIALEELVDDGEIRKDDYAILVGFGAGLFAVASVVRFG